MWGVVVNEIESASVFLGGWTKAGPQRVPGIPFGGPSCSAPIDIDHLLSLAVGQIIRIDG